MRRIVTLVLAMLAVVSTLALASPAHASAAGGQGVTVDAGWGRLQIKALVDDPGPGGHWVLRYRDTRRDGSCVRAVLVNEDMTTAVASVDDRGANLQVGPKSCGRWVTWRPHAMAEDWPAPALVKLSTGEVVGQGFGFGG